MTTRAYISGPLTGMDNISTLKKFYEEMAEVCKAESIEAYVPHLSTDPIQNPNMTAQEVYKLDQTQVAAANIVLAYVGSPSLGVGQEIEIAREHNVPVLLLMETDAKISRMARGNPAVIAEIRFSGFQDALQQLSLWMHEWQR